MWHADVGPSVPDLLTLVAPEGWNSLFGDTPARGVFEQRIPARLPGQPALVRRARAQDRIRSGLRDMLVCRGPRQAGGWRSSRSVSPTARCSNTVCPWLSPGKPRPTIPCCPCWSHTLCRIRRGGRVGVLYDATGDPDFARTLAAKMHEGAVSGEDGECRLAFSRSNAFPDDVDLTDIETRRLGKEQTNTSVILGSSIIVKMYRRLDAGIHPEVEVGRFLTERAGSVKYAEPFSVPWRPSIPRGVRPHWRWPRLMFGIRATDGISRWNIWSACSTKSCCCPPRSARRRRPIAYAVFSSRSGGWGNVRRRSIWRSPETVRVPSHRPGPVARTFNAGPGRSSVRQGPPCSDCVRSAKACPRPCVKMPIAC